MDYLLREQERLQSRVRRYESPDEHPFYLDALEKPILQPLQYPKILHDNDVNVNEVIKQRYVNEILPAICPQPERGDRGEAQENYGSAATADVNCLQALSRRIHFGKFVAESKFQKDPETFVKMIKGNDRQGIDAAITDSKVEQKVLERLGLKARTYGTDPAFSSESGPKIDTEADVSMYKVSLGLRQEHSGHANAVSELCYPSHQGRGGGLPYAASAGNPVGVTGVRTDALRNSIYVETPEIQSIHIYFFPNNQSLTSLYRGFQVISDIFHCCFELGSLNQQQTPSRLDTQFLECPFRIRMAFIMLVCVFKRAGALCVTF